MLRTLHQPELALSKNQLMKEQDSCTELQEQQLLRSLKNMYELLRKLKLLCK